MNIFIILMVCIIPIIIAFFFSNIFIYFSLFIGHFPISLRESILTPFGNLHISSIKLFGILLGSFLINMIHIGAIYKYFIRYRYHFFFLIFCTISLLWTPSLTYGIRMLAKLSAPLFFLLSIMALISKKNHLRWMENIILISGVLVFLTAIFTKLAGLNPKFNLTIPGESPAVFTSHLLVVGMIAFVNIKYSNHLRNTILFIIFAIGILWGFTRITIAGMFIGLSIILFISTRGIFRILLPSTGLISFILLFFISEKFKERMFLTAAKKITLLTFINDPIETISHIAGSGRFAAWNYILKRFFNPNPIIGSGIGATQDYFYSSSPSGLGVIHSEYIRLISEIGIVGLIFFVILALFYLIILIHNYKSALSIEAKKYALAGIGGLVGYLIFMATDNAFDYFNTFALFIFSLIAMSEKTIELEKLERNKY